MKATLQLALAMALGAAAANLGADYETVGTIQATLSGKQKTWHVIVDADDEVATGAIWMILPSGDGDTATAAIGGFESTDVVFSQDPDTGHPRVTGEGSQLVISFEFPLNASKVEVDLPTKGANSSSLILLPAVGDYSQMSGMDRGTISISRIEANKTGSSRFEGTFSGRLVDRAGEEIGELVNGRFKVGGARFFNADEVE
jgi:hypothetical protein